MSNKNQSQPLISVVVPVYNTKEYLEKCINSIVSQSYKNLEIIIVNDGSTDGSNVICDLMKDKYCNVFVIHKENGGLSSARNVGIEKAHGGYIAFVDSDDWIEPKMYETLYDALKKSKCRIACCGRYDVSEKTGKKTLGLCPNKNETVSSIQCVKKIFLWDGIDSSACDKLFDIRVFEKERFPDKKISEDVAIMYKIFLDEENICLINKPFYNYNHRNDSITTSVFKKEKMDIDDHSKRIVQYIKQYYPELVESAQYFRAKEIIYLYTLIVHNNQSNNYMNELNTYSKEIRQYYSILKKYDCNMMNIKYRLTIMSMICSPSYIVYSKLKSTIKKIVNY